MARDIRETQVFTTLGEPLPTEAHESEFIFAVEEADEMLIKCEGGVEYALEYAKMWCKYVKELLFWIDKRLNYGESL